MGESEKERNPNHLATKAVTVMFSWVARHLTSLFDSKKQQSEDANSEVVTDYLSFSVLSSSSPPTIVGPNEQAMSPGISNDSPIFEGDDSSSSSGSSSRGCDDREPSFSVSYQSSDGAWSKGEYSTQTPADHYDRINNPVMSNVSDDQKRTSFNKESELSSYSGSLTRSSIFELRESSTWGRGHHGSSFSASSQSSDGAWLKDEHFAQTPADHDDRINPHKSNVSDDPLNKHCFCTSLNKESDLSFSRSRSTFELGGSSSWSRDLHKSSSFSASSESSHSSCLTENSPTPQNESIIHIQNIYHINATLNVVQSSEEVNQTRTSVFDLELPKLKISLAATLLIGTMTLHYSQPKHFDWPKTVILCLLIVLGMTALFAGLIVQPSLPRYASWITILGYLLIFASFHGIIVIFLWKTKILLVVPALTFVSSIAILLFVRGCSSETLDSVV